MGPERPEGKPGPGSGEQPKEAEVKIEQPGQAEAEPKEAAPPASEEDMWKEDYEEHIDAEPEPAPRPKRKRKGQVSIVLLLVVIAVLILWTLFSPPVMPQSGEVYTSSQHYANLGSFIGYRDIWAGNMTWGLSIGGNATVQAGAVLNITVLVTKVYERPGNWFLRGSAISLRNVSVFTDDGVFVGEMSNWTDAGFGQIATVPLVFSEPGNYSLFVYAKFLVYMDMRIGFLPLEAVEIQRAYLDVPIVVT